MTGPTTSAAWRRELAAAEQEDEQERQREAQLTERPFDHPEPGIMYQRVELDAEGGYRPIHHEQRQQIQALLATIKQACHDLGPVIATLPDHRVTDMLRSLRRTCRDEMYQIHRALQE